MSLRSRLGTRYFGEAPLAVASIDCNDRGVFPVPLLVRNDIAMSIPEKQMWPNRSDVTLSTLLLPAFHKQMVGFYGFAGMHGLRCQKLRLAIRTKIASLCGP